MSSFNLPPGVSPADIPGNVIDESPLLRNFLAARREAQAAAEKAASARRNLENWEQRLAKALSDASLQGVYVDGMVILLDEEWHEKSPGSRLQVVERIRS